jgi:hypothetical protein
MFFSCIERQHIGYTKYGWLRIFKFLQWKNVIVSYFRYSVHHGSSLSWSNARKLSKKRKHLNRYFTHFQELSKTLEESTSGVTEDTITVANGNKLKAKVVIIISSEHCLGIQKMM